MFAKRRVYGESRAGEYSFGPEHSQPPARQESGPVTKRPVPRLTGRQSARLAVLIDTLRRSQKSSALPALLRLSVIRSFLRFRRRLRLCEKVPERSHP